MASTAGPKRPKLFRKEIQKCIKYVHSLGDREYRTTKPIKSPLV